MSGQRVGLLLVGKQLPFFYLLPTTFYLLPTTFYVLVKQQQQQQQINASPHLSGLRFVSIFRRRRRLLSCLLPEFSLLSSLAKTSRVRRSSLDVGCVAPFDWLESSLPRASSIGRKYESRYEWTKQSSLCRLESCVQSRETQLLSS